MVACYSFVNLVLWLSSGTPLAFDINNLSMILFFVYCKLGVFIAVFWLFEALLFILRVFYFCKLNWGDADGWSFPIFAVLLWMVIFI